MALEMVSGVIKTIQGQQGRVGDRVAKWWKFSILEIGEKVLKDIVANERFIVFLNAGNEGDVWLDGKQVVALGRADGKVFLVNYKKPGIVSLIIAVALIPLYGIGLLVLAARYFSNKQYNKINNEILPKYTSFESLTS